MLHEYPDCEKLLCYECIKLLLDDILSEACRIADEGDPFSDAIIPINAANKPPKVQGHRRAFSEDVSSLTQKSIFQKPDHQNLSQNNRQQFYYDESVARSFKETEELKNFIFARKWKPENVACLEEENSHFLLSEMLLAAIEQMKWRNVISSSHNNQNASNSNFSQPLNLVTTSSLDDSSSNVGHNFTMDNFPSCSSFMSPRTSSSSSHELCSEMPSRQNSFSDITTTSPFNVPVVPLVFSQTDFSAERTAAELLSRFSKLHFSNLMKNLQTQQQCVIPFDDAPQELLPMPSSISVFPVESSQDQSFIADWTPIRPQIIFNMQKLLKLRVLLHIQKNRCPGCGRYIESSFSKRLRFCNYYGKAFCQCCHRGDYRLIPAIVIHRWDFRPMPVCDLACQFLSENFQSPFYDILILNPALYGRVKILRQTLQLRIRLAFTYDYLRTCRVAEKVVTRDGILLKLFDELPYHLLRDFHAYSMSDFIKVNDETLPLYFEKLLSYAVVHITDCEFCKAKGFVCEICKQKPVVFPFQESSIVKRCDFCGSCFHRKCFSSKKQKTNHCPKCLRIEIRKETHMAPENMS